MSFLKKILLNASNNGVSFLVSYTANATCENAGTSFRANLKDSATMFGSLPKAPQPQAPRIIFL
jgi:hypothetical protein